MEYRWLINGNLEIIDNKGRFIQLTPEEVFELNIPVTKHYNKTLEDATKQMRKQNESEV